MTEKIRIHHIDDKPRYLTAAPEEIRRACAIRFDYPNGQCATTRKRNEFKWDPQNFWDGWTPVTRLPNGNLEFIRIYEGVIEEFDLDGQTVGTRPRA